LPALLLAFYGVETFCVEGDGEPGLGWVCTSDIMERCRCEAITELIGEALAGVFGGVGSAIAGITNVVSLCSESGNDVSRKAKM
jgi:hypothetical protein